MSRLQVENPISVKNPCIRATAIIEEVYKGGMFAGHLEDNPDHSVLLTVAGRMQHGKIKVVRGDAVDAELSPYDLTRGRIVWRHHDPQQRGRKP